MITVCKVLHDHRQDMVVWLDVGGKNRGFLPDLPKTNKFPQVVGFILYLPLNLKNPLYSIMFTLEGKLTFPAWDKEILGGAAR